MIPPLREQVRPLVYSSERFDTLARPIQCCPGQPQGSFGGTAQANPRDTGSPRAKKARVRIQKAEGSGARDDKPWECAGESPEHLTRFTPLNPARTGSTHP